MKISEIAEKTGLKAINDYGDREVESVYISDMVSDLITSAKRNSILITLQTHKSLIAAASVVAAAMIVIVKGRRPSDDVVELADEDGDRALHLRPRYVDLREEARAARNGISLGAGRRKGGFDGVVPAALRGRQGFSRGSGGPDPRAPAGPGRARLPRVPMRSAGSRGGSGSPRTRSTGSPPSSPSSAFHRRVSTSSRSASAPPAT